MKNDFVFAYRDEGFDTHIEKSIRGYTQLHDDVVGLSEYFVENDTNVYDLGCSTGKTLGCIFQKNFKNKPNAKYIGIDYADGFVEDMNEKRSQIGVEYLSFRNEDLRESKLDNASFVTSIFTLQFIAKKDRQRIVDNVYKSLNDGAAFILCEKTIASNSKFQDILTSRFLEYKGNHFSNDDLIEKERTLRSMMKPDTAEDLYCMLYKAGFTQIQQFWQNHLFIGLIAIK